MLKTAIIIGSVRPTRFAIHPAKWIFDLAAARGDMAVETLDLVDYPLPFFNEKTSPAYAPTEDPVSRRWQQKIAEHDAFIVIAPEYNRGPTGVLKNALDYAYNEWNRKPIAYVGYGSVGGARAIEQLRLVAVEQQMAPVRTGVHIQWPVYMAVAAEGKKLSDFDFLNQTANDMLGQLAWWGRALKTARDSDRRQAA